MNARHTQERSKVASRIVGSAILLLLGTVAMIVGHEQGNHLFLYAGLIVTVAGVLTGIVFLLLRQPAGTREKRLR